MVSIASLKPSPAQNDVHFSHFGLTDFIFDDKSGYASDPNGPVNCPAGGDVVSCSADFNMVAGSETS